MRKRSSYAVRPFISITFQFSKKSHVKNSLPLNILHSIRSEIILIHSSNKSILFSSAPIFRVHINLASILIRMPMLEFLAFEIKMKTSNIIFEMLLDGLTFYH